MGRPYIRSGPAVGGAPAPPSQVLPPGVPGRRAVEAAPAPDLPGARAHWLVIALLAAVVVGILTLAIGIYPEPFLQLAQKSLLR